MTGLYSPFKIAVHDSEEDLEEEVDGVYQHRQQVQPCFAGHCGRVRDVCHRLSVRFKVWVKCVTMKESAGADNRRRGVRPEIGDGRVVEIAG